MFGLTRVTTLLSGKAAAAAAAAAVAAGGGGLAVAVTHANSHSQVTTVQACKKALPSGEHGIGQCVSAHASQHGKSERNQHANGAHGQSSSHHGQSGAAHGHAGGSESPEPSDTPDPSDTPEPTGS